MRYLVYREELVGSVEAPNWTEASGRAFKDYGDHVTRVSPAAGVADGRAKSRAQQ